MPTNRIPRHADGSRDWTRLTSDERILLASVYRQPNRNADELARATGLSRGRLGTALRALQSPQRCGPLGVPTVLVRSATEGSPARYSVSESWRATRRVSARPATRRGATFAA